MRDKDKEMKSDVVFRRLRIGSGEKTDRPCIRIAGDWLKKCGFEVGHWVKVEVGYKQLTIYYDWSSIVETKDLH